MMFFRSLVVLCPAACLLAQTPALQPAAPKPSASKPAAAKPSAAKPSTAKPAAQNPAANTDRPASTPAPALKLTEQAPAAASGPALSDLPPEKVIITVGEEKITAGELSRIINNLPEQFRNSANGAGRKQFVENYVRVKVLAQEGKRRKLDQDANYLAQLSLQRDNLLASSAYTNIAQHTEITEQQIKQYYDEHKNEFETVRAAHILVRFKGSPAPVRPGQKDLTEEEALAKIQQLRKEILAGAKFGDVARRESDDGGSGVQEGDLGTFHRGQMVPAFEQVAFALPIGQLSEPVKTSFGYHLIKVSQRDVKNFEQAKAEIDKKLRPQEAMKVVEGLQRTTPVVIDPQFMGEDKKNP